MIELSKFHIFNGCWCELQGIGFTRFTKRKEGGYEETETLTRSYYEKKLVLCFGSSIAAQLLLPFGEQNDLSKYEIQEAKKVRLALLGSQTRTLVMHVFQTFKYSYFKPYN